MDGKTYNNKALFWICVLALFTAALANAIRAGAAGAMKAALLDPIDAAHSGEMIGAVLGNSFLGFAISLLVISPLLDRFGAKKVVLFASACFVAGPVLVLLAGSAGSNVYVLLNLAMVIWGFGWGATEASINPVTATLYPNDKTGRLNTLHAWWPFGIVVGGLLSVLFFNTLKLDWQVLVALPIIPGLITGLWALKHEFPPTESTAAGVSFNEMMAEPFKRPGFWIFFIIMFLTASAELAPGAWVDVALTSTVGMSGILVLVYVSAIMFIMRHFAGALDKKFSDMGLLMMCTVPAAIGLWLLSTANSPFTRDCGGDFVGDWRVLHVADDAGGHFAPLSEERTMGHWPHRFCRSDGNLLRPAAIGEDLRHGETGKGGRCGCLRRPDRWLAGDAIRLGLCRRGVV